MLCVCARTRHRAVPITWLWPGWEGAFIHSSPKASRDPQPATAAHHLVLRRLSSRARFAFDLRLLRGAFVLLRCCVCWCSSRSRCCNWCCRSCCCCCTRIRSGAWTGETARTFAARCRPGDVRGRGCGAAVGVGKAGCQCPVGAMRTGIGQLRELLASRSGGPGPAASSL